MAAPVNCNFLVRGLAGVPAPLCQELGARATILSTALADKARYVSGAASLHAPPDSSIGLGSAFGPPVW